MAKKDKGKKEKHAGAPEEKLTNKKYEEKMLDLQVEMVKLQTWIRQTGAQVMVVFEGRDAAGKGGVIKRLTERVSPRIFKVVALPSPTGAGTTARAWKTSWAFAARPTTSASS